MGKCETSTTSIGIKILLSDLILQINETNFDLIKEMLNDGFISDKNENYNDAYTEIIWCNDLPKNYLEFKEFLEQELGISRITAASYLNKLADDGLLRKEKLGTANYYVNHRLFEILSK
jgi:hypothetical protein